VLCHDLAQARQAAQNLGWPVVMKMVSQDVMHKSEMGGVLLNIGDLGAVDQGFDHLLGQFKKAAPQAMLEGILIAQQMQGGVECILGIQQDPVFGPVAVFGLGGIFVEVMQDVVLRRCPFSPETARHLILSIRGAPLLLGARGRPIMDVNALAEMLSKLSLFACAAGPRLLSIDLNPVMVLPEGQGAFALDAVIELDLVVELNDAV
jgi:acetate---CoA ligase (ADP-forming)